MKRLLLLMLFPVLAFAQTTKPPVATGSQDNVARDSIVTHRRNIDSLFLKVGVDNATRDSITVHRSNLNLKLDKADTASLSARINLKQAAGTYLVPSDTSSLTARFAAKQAAGTYLIPSDTSSLTARFAAKQAAGTYLIPSDTSSLTARFNAKQAAGTYLIPSDTSSLTARFAAKQAAGTYLVPSDTSSLAARFSNTKVADSLTSGTLPIARMPNSGVGAGSYTYPYSVTVDQYGRVTAATTGNKPAFGDTLLTKWADSTGLASASRAAMVWNSTLNKWQVQQAVKDGSTALRMLFKASGDSIGVMGRIFVPSGLVAGGTGNNAAIIQRAVDSAYANGGGIVSLPSAVYGISASITLPSNTTLDGNGSTLKLTGVPSSEGVVKNRLYGSRDSNITIRNLIIDVDSITNDQDVGTNSFVFYKADHVTIENCANYDNRNYGFYFNACTDVKLVNCRARNVDSPFEFRAGTHGVQITNCSNVMGPYSSLGMYFWENTHGVEVNGFHSTGVGISTGTTGLRISDSYDINLNNLYIDTEGPDDVAFDFAMDNIGTPDLNVMDPYAVAMNCKNINVSNSVFKTGAVALASYADTTYQLENVKFTGVHFERHVAVGVDEDHRLINIGSWSDGMTFVNCSFMGGSYFTPQYIIFRAPERLMIANCKFNTAAHKGQAVTIVEPWRCTITNSDFGDSLILTTDVYSDSMSRHPEGNFYNNYTYNTFNCSSSGNMNLQVENFSLIHGNKFLYADAADTSKPLILSVYSRRNTISSNLFKTPAITDNGFYNTYSNNYWNDSDYTSRSVLGKATIDTLIVGRDKGYQWFGPRTRLEVADTTRVGTSVNDNVNIAEVAGRVVNDDVGLLTSLVKIATGSDWQSTAMRQSFVVDDAFRTGATSSTWTDFAPYRFRIGVDGVMKYDLRKLGATFYPDSVFFPGKVSIGGWDFASGFYPLAVNGASALYGKVYFKEDQLNSSFDGNNAGFTLDHSGAQFIIAGKVKAASTPYYANKAAARAAGLTSGAIYSTVTAAGDTILAIIP